MTSRNIKKPSTSKHKNVNKDSFNKKSGALINSRDKDKKSSHGRIQKKQNLDSVNHHHNLNPSTTDVQKHRYLYGLHTVRAALDNPHRILKKLLVTPARQGIFESYASCVSLTTITAEEMTNILPAGAVHQGVALLAELKDIAETRDYTESEAPVIILDSVNDPQNIGAILRTSAAFGVRHLIMQERGSPDITGAMAKVAAGGLEVVRIHRVPNLSRVIEALQSRNFIVYGADGDSEQSLPQVKFAPKSVIIMGAEGTGLRRLIREKCDMIVKIPMTDTVVESLNVANALSIILYSATMFR